jgi:hypothetical protein
MHKTRSVILLIILLQSMSIQIVTTLGVDEGPEGTLVGGKIRSNTIWTKENNPYILHDNILVPRGVKLTIEEGVVVDLHIWSMTIEGSLRVSGTPDERILLNVSEMTLSSYNKARLWFTNNSAPWKEGSIDGCRLEYVDIHCANYTAEYGLIKGGTLKLDHVAIHGSRYHNKKYTVESDGLVTNCLFDGVILALNMEVGTVINNRFVNIKQGAAITIYNGTVKDNIIDGAVRGINVKNAYVKNNTILNTQINRILIKNEDIPWNQTKLKPVITSNLIMGCEEDAVRITGEIKPILTRNVFMDNANGVYFDVDSFKEGVMPRIEYNVFHGNDNNIYVDREDPRILIHLEDNWWGIYSTETIHEKIFDEQDDPQTCTILVEPFLADPPSSLPEIHYSFEASCKHNQIELNEENEVTGKITPPLETFDIQLACTGPDGDGFEEGLKTDGEGSFVYEFTPDQVGVWSIALTPGEHELLKGLGTKELEFNVTKISSSIDCSLSPATPLVGEEVTLSGGLTPALSGERVQIEVTDPNGIRYHSQATTDSDGEFEYKHERETHGEYSVTFMWDGTEEVEAASETAVFRVHRPSWLEIFIKDETGSPVPDAIVRMVIQPPSQASLADSTDEEGRAVFQDILSGEYSFAVEKTDYETSTVTSQIDEGEASELTVGLEKNISEEPSPPVVDGRPVSGGAPLYYGFIPSALIFVILIVLYTTINGINKSR